ncbi:acyl-CoA synthetase [Taklimakanibacter deserti]|uniref:acyl-CoA synthetase n=1 Tax=Taklimakanibacter deserti TaxID=2267839 RepID=UPI000E6482FA
MLPSLSRGEGLVNDIYQRGLERNAANYTPLSPVSFLDRTALAFPDKIAVIDRSRRYSYGELHQRARRLASALTRRGIGKGDTVAILAPNVPAMIEAHFGVPMAGAVLNCLNIRLDAPSIAFCLSHGEAKLVLVDRQYLSVMVNALSQVSHRLAVVVMSEPDAEATEFQDYEAFLAGGDPQHLPSPPTDEWSPISLGYTSGTTGDPKGVVCHHRGAYLNALGNALEAGLASTSVYLWTLPMFHCNGWCYIWAVTAVGGTHVCLRQVEVGAIFTAIKEHGVTHFCGAPVILNMIAKGERPPEWRLERPVDVLTGGAAPPSAVIAGMEELGFRIKHLYGLTESFGPALVCAWHEEWTPLPLAERARLTARQGVNFITLEAVRVVDPETGEDRPADGIAMGEIMLRGNTVMMGYLKNPEASAKAFADGWFHTGDLGVRHPDGYVEVKDRSKDIIISGGENISSLEIEEVLYRHPAILEAAVVAAPDEKWGEHPCAFIDLKSGMSLAPEAVIQFCRDNMAHYKVPRTVIFGPLPKTATGKIQKYALRERAAALR